MGVLSAFEFWPVAPALQAGGLGQMNAHITIETIPTGLGGTAATIERMRQAVLETLPGKSHEGAHHPDVVMLARKLVEHLPSKDYEAEARAIFEFMRSRVRYTLDPRNLEWVQTPFWTLLVAGQGDCFVTGTLVLQNHQVHGRQLSAVESLREGDEIWGHDRWTKVTRVWGSKGVLPTFQVLLNNGGNMRLTPGHLVWVADCARHAHRSKSCSCRVDERDLARVPVEELRDGMTLLQPDRITPGSGECDPDRALLEGFYLSEGWGEGYRFAISGLEGGKKQWVRDEVVRVCEKFGLRHRVTRKYISINNKDWAERLSMFGSRVAHKAHPSLDCDDRTAEQLLRGIMADSGANTNGGGRTFTTTSRSLWLQARVMLKQLGVTCSQSYITDHGGLGTNPIWRLGVRDMKRSDGKAMKLLRVKEVIRDNVELPCWDIETEDHFVWLPEADWTVSQCDDHSTATCALATALGHGCGVRTVKADPNRPDDFSHVYPIIGIRKHGVERWYPIDSTEAGARFGQDPPGADRMPKQDWIFVPA